MQKTKIEWCDSTWNPVTGCCHECEYCYARKIAKRFGGASETDYEGDCIWRTDAEGTLHDLDYPVDATDMGLKKTPYPFKFDPTFHRYRLKQPKGWKKPQNIFVCSMGDLFGEWVPDEWIDEVFKGCEEAPQHNYLFLTKNPGRYIMLEKTGKLPHRGNMWFGSTVTGPHDFYLWMRDVLAHWFLSVEPIHAPLGKMNVDAEKPEWVIIGAESGNRIGKIIPQKAWIYELTRECDKYGIPVFMKNSLIPILGNDNMRREIPNALTWQKEM